MLQAPLRLILGDCLLYQFLVVQNLNGCLKLIHLLTHCLSGFLNPSDSLSLIRLLIRCLNHFLNLSDSLSLTRLLIRYLNHFLNLNGSLSLIHLLTHCLSDFLNLIHLLTRYLKKSPIHYLRSNHYQC